MFFSDCSFFRKTLFHVLFRLFLFPKDAFPSQEPRGADVHEIGNSGRPARLPIASKQTTLPRLRTMRRAGDKVPGARNGARCSARSPFGDCGTRFKVDKARQPEWLQSPVLDKRTWWPLGIVTPLADIAVLRAGGDQEDDQACPCGPCPQPSVDGTRQASPTPQGDHAAVLVHMCCAVDALEGERGTLAYAAVEQDCYFVLRRGEGDVLARMLLCCLELADIGERRVVVVPDLEPAELTLDDVVLLEVEADQDFWGMIPSRRATYRDVQGAKEQSKHTRSIAHQLPRRVDSRRARLPPIPEVPRVDA